MGIISSRAVLLKPPEPRKSEVYPRTNLNPISPLDRLVCDELRKEVQRSLSHQKPETCDRVSLLQVTSKGVQQEDVRSLLSMQESPISRHGHHSGTTELF